MKDEVEQNVEKQAGPYDGTGNAHVKHIAETRFKESADAYEENADRTRDAVEQAVEDRKNTVKVEGTISDSPVEDQQPNTASGSGQHMTASTKIEVKLDASFADD